MRVALNTFPLSSGHAGRGVGFYTKYLLEELKKIKSLEIQEFGELSEVKDADIIHYPYFDLFYHTLKVHKTIPTVVTIHDVTPLVFSKHYPPGIRGKIKFLMQKNELKKVKGVITDSEASKKDVHKFLPIDEKNIYVTYLAQGDHFKQIKDKNVLKEVKDKFNLPENFVLFTGNVNWNKNIVNLTKGCINAKMDLVLVGKSFESNEDINHAEHKNFKEFITQYRSNPLIHVLGFVSDDELVCLMNLATVVMLPSFYEGFGMTILEAQACGTPVITSNISSMPEVAGEGALYVDPYSEKTIAGAIDQLTFDEKLADKLAKKGLENVKRFSWTKTTQETVKAYESILK